jgi:hypothetical protein
MLLPSRKTRHGLRAALHDARDTYRRHSGADAHSSEPAASPKRAEAPEADPGVPVGHLLPALARNGRQAARRLRERSRHATAGRDQPDVVLDVPTLHVDEIDLKLKDLKARVALEANVLDLLRLNIGVDAELGGVALNIKGVDAEAHLRVRLDNLTQIIDRVMSTIDDNPQILTGLTEGLGATLAELGNGAGTAVGELGKGAGSAVGAIPGAIAPGSPNGNGTPAP